MVSGYYDQWLLWSVTTGKHKYCLPDKVSVFINLSILLGLTTQNLILFPADLYDRAHSD